MGDGTAVVLGVSATPNNLRVVGVGEARGYLSTPVMLRFEGMNILMRVVILPGKGNLPLVLGMPALMKLGLRMSFNPKRESEYITPQRDNCSDKGVMCKPLHEHEHIHTVQVCGMTTPLSFEESLQQIQESFDKSLSSAQTQEILEVFKEYKSVWYSPPAGGSCQAGEAQIEAVGRPFRCKLRPLNEVLKLECKKQLDVLLSENLILPSKSAWAAAPVFIRKKDGSWRMAIDYRQLNKNTIPDAYPIPNLWDCIHYAANKKYVIVLDLISGFWNIRLTKESRSFTAFITPFGLYEWRVLPFGLRNAPSEFQRVIDFALRNVNNVVVYIDDIIISANEWCELTSKLSEVLQALRVAGLHLNIKKAQLNCTKAKVLGHLVSLEGIRADPIKVQALLQAPSPKSKEEIRSFMGLLNFLNKYINNMSIKAKVITDVLCKDVVFTWEKEHQDAFEELKLTLGEAILLQSPDNSKEIILECDASALGVGAVLKQKQHNDEVILEFASKKFNVTQRKWSTQEREAYAIRWSLEHFASLIRGMKIHLRTDHKSLIWMNSAQETKVFRWIMYMQQFEIYITHINGTQNKVADYLSRCSVDDADDDEDWSSIQVPTNKIENITKHIGFISNKEQIQIRLPVVPKIADLILALERNGIPETERKWLYVSSNKLYYHIHTNKLYVPEVFRKAFLFWNHSGRFGGHHGMTRTLNRLKTQVWWLNMHTDVYEYVQKCEACARNTPPNKRYLRRSLENPLPFESISLDFVGPRTYKGQQYWYAVIIDHATRYVVVNTIMHHPTSRDVLRILHLRWITLFGVPANILLDNDSIYNKDVTQYLTVVLGSKVIHSSPGYPQGNGLNETSHKVMEKSIGIQVQACADLPFEDIVSEAAFSHNLAPNVQVGDSPFRRLFGMEAAMPHYQELTNLNMTENTRKMMQMEGRIKQAVMYNIKQQQEMLLKPCHNIKVGDTIVYYKTEYQCRRDAHISDYPQYSSSWSLPHAVVEVKDASIICKEIHNRQAKPRQVPLRLCRKLTSLREGLQGGGISNPLLSLAPSLSLTPGGTDVVQGNDILPGDQEHHGGPPTKIPRIKVLDDDKQPANEHMT